MINKKWVIIIALLITTFYSHSQEVLLNLNIGNEIKQNRFTTYVDSSWIKNEGLNQNYIFWQLSNAQKLIDLGKFDEAERHYSRIEKDYPKSEEAKNISVYIQRAQIAQK